MARTNNQGTQRARIFPDPSLRFIARPSAPRTGTLMSDNCSAVAGISGDMRARVTQQAKTFRWWHGARCFAVQMSKGIMENDQELNPDDREIVIGLCDQLFPFLMSVATEVMHVLGETSTKLARLPAPMESSTARAGMTFPMLQGVEPLYRLRWSTFFCVSASPIGPSRQKPVARGRRKLFDEPAEPLAVLNRRPKRKHGGRRVTVTQHIGRSGARRGQL